MIVFLLLLFTALALLTPTSSFAGRKTLYSFYVYEQTSYARDGMLKIEISDTQGPYGFSYLMNVNINSVCSSTVHLTGGVADGWLSSVYSAQALAGYGLSGYASGIVAYYGTDLSDGSYGTNYPCYSSSVNVPYGGMGLLLYNKSYYINSTYGYRVGDLVICADLKGNGDWGCEWYSVYNSSPLY